MLTQAGRHTAQDALQWVQPQGAVIPGKSLQDLLCLRLHQLRSSVWQPAPCTLDLLSHISSSDVCSVFHWFVALSPVNATTRQSLKVLESYLKTVVRISCSNYDMLRSGYRLQHLFESTCRHAAPSGKVQFTVKRLADPPSQNQTV